MKMKATKDNGFLKVAQQAHLKSELHIVKPSILWDVNVVFTFCHTEESRKPSRFNIFWQSARGKVQFSLMHFRMQFIVISRQCTIAIALEERVLSSSSNFEQGHL